MRNFVAAMFHLHPGVERSQPTAEPPAEPPRCEEFTPGYKEPLWDRLGVAPDRSRTASDVESPWERGL